MKPRNRKTNLDESRIQKSCIDFMSLHGYDTNRTVKKNGYRSNKGIVFSVPNESMGLQWGARMKRQGRLAGVSDLIIAMPKGKSIYVEVKDEKKKQTKNQKAFEIAIKMLGFDYLVWRSLDDCMQFVENGNRSIDSANANYESALVIGRYSISDSGYRPDTHFWIEHESGEGSEFLKSDVAKFFREYYEHNF